MRDHLHQIAFHPAIQPSPLAKHQGGVRWETCDGVTFLATGAPGPAANFVMALDQPPPPERLLHAADEFFGPAAGGYSITITADTGAALEQALWARGWVLDEEEPGLVLEPIPEPPPAPPELTIVRVANEAGLRRFFAALRDEWGDGGGRDKPSPDTAGEPAQAPPPLPPLTILTDPDIALFIGYHGAHPVATSRLYMYFPEGVADLTAVMTRPDFRRRGYGTAMTWAALAEARGRGCAAATLTATAMGYPVYIKMGFVPVCVFRTYAPPSA